MATVKEIIERTYTKVNGEYEAVTVNSDDWNTYLNVLNQVMETWADWPYVKWQSLYNMDYELPDAVVGGQLSYPFVDSHKVVLGNSPFDSVYFVDNSGKVLQKYVMLDQAQFDATSNPLVCAWFGDTLQLKSTSDDIVGAKIRLPIYVKPPQYTAPAQEVKIDNTSWLISYMSAFLCDASPVPFIARNADKYYDQAKTFMKTMKANNSRTQALIIKTYDNSTPHTWDDVMANMTMKDL